jgi:lauroyl/myristoyl acyltransferase
MLLALRQRAFTDFVVMRRLRNGQDDLETWDYVEHNVAAVQALRAAGRPYLIATAHFAREASIALHSKAITPNRLLLILASPPAFTLRPGLLRVRVLLNQILKTLWRMRPDMEPVFAGGPPANLARAVHRARTPGHTMVITIDTPWYHQGGYETTFAGHARLPLSTATAKLARLAQVPIVPCIPEVIGPEKIAFHWGNPIPPPRSRDESADQATMDQIIAFIEQAIGQRPDQYVLTIGDVRRWNATEQRWRSRDQ